MRLLSEDVLSVEERAAIGTVVLETTYLEYYVAGLCWQLMGVKQAAGEVVTNRLSIMPRLDFLLELGCSSLKEPKLTVFKKLIVDLKEQIEHRNIIVHGTWIGQMEKVPDLKRAVNPSGEETSILRLAPAMSLFQRKKKWRKFSAKDIENTAKQISKLHRD